MVVRVGWKVGLMEVRIDSMLKESGGGRGGAVVLFRGVDEGLGVLKKGMDRRRGGGVEGLFAVSGCF